MARARGGHPPLPWLLLLFVGLFGRVGAFCANPLSSNWASNLVQGSTRPVVGPGEVDPPKASVQISSWKGHADQKSRHRPSLDTSISVSCSCVPGPSVVSAVRAFQDDGEGGKGAKGGGADPNDEERAIREAIEKNRRAAEQASKLLERGVTAQQLEAYTGIKLVELPMDEGPTLRVTPSNQFVDRDGDGRSVGGLGSWGTIQPSILEGVCAGKRLTGLTSSGW